MANDRVYIHERIDIIGHGRAKYMHHMTANWCPIGRAERGQLCFGVWGTVGSTGRWPEVVNLWEERGWDGLAASFSHETAHPGMQDPSLAVWWAEAAKYRSGGLDRILVPAPWTRTIEELCRDGVRAGAFTAHEIVQVLPGRAPEFLERVREVGLPVYASFGLALLGAFRSAMCNDSECVLLWSIPRASQWAAFERAQDGAEMARWRDAVRGIAQDWRRTLLVDAPLSPLRTGRQPQESDRRPLEEIR